MNIIKNTSTVHTGYRKGRKIEFLVIHYTAGSTSRKGIARNVASMFGNSANRAASADFIVDDEEIVQFNPDLRNRYCYAVGGTLQNSYGGKLFGKAVNQNCISIEICSSNSTGKVVNEFNHPSWYFTDKAVNNAIELSRYIMQEFNIPAEHLIRHFDVNSKPCPNIIGWNTYAGNTEEKWLAFKKAVLSGGKAESVKEKEMTETEIRSIVQDELSKYFTAVKEKAEPDWSASEGYWGKATDMNVVDGKGPMESVTRCQLTAILGRLGLLGD